MSLTRRRTPVLVHRHAIEGGETPSARGSSMTVPALSTPSRRVTDSWTASCASSSVRPTRRAKPNSPCPYRSSTSSVIRTDPPRARRWAAAARPPGRRERPPASTAARQEQALTWTRRARACRGGASTSLCHEGRLDGGKRVHHDVRTRSAASRQSATWSSTHASITDPSVGSGNAPWPSTTSWKPRMSNRLPRRSRAASRSRSSSSWPIL